MREEYTMMDMRIAIIGGGAAGLMAAATLQELRPDAEVFLIEGNRELGKKVTISGGGRCNVTTGIEAIPEVLTRYPRGTKFLAKAMYRFSPKAVRQWFEDRGVPLKVEEDLRVFPVSDRGRDVVDLFERLFADSNVKVLLEHHAVKLERILKAPASAGAATGGDGFRLHFKTQAPLDVDVAVITTGGQAFRHTGSTGDGYAFAEGLGHTITKLAPSLNSFFTKEEWPKALSGLSFPWAEISAEPESQTSNVKRQKFGWAGPFLFTHRGISGPAVFALSGLIAFETYDAAHPLPLFIDLFTDKRPEELEEDLVQSFKEHSKKAAVTILGFFVPKSLVEHVMTETGVDFEKNGADVSKAEVRALAGWLKRIPLHAIGRGAGDEFVTAGGVTLSEVDPSTMESKITPGLFFAGEVLDVDGFTGGFNLQASWAAGRVAGESISGK